MKSTLLHEDEFVSADHMYAHARSWFDHVSRTNLQIYSP